MAVNQVSLFFYPPRWQQLLRSDPTALTNEGKPLQIAHTVPVPNAIGLPVTKASMKKWLAEHGFTPVDWGEGLTFQRGQVRSYFGLEKEVEVSLGDVTGEVAELYCRFTLQPRIPPALADWAELMAELCRHFDLRLGADGKAPCSASEFVVAVEDHRFYREFAERFGWETNPVETAAADSAPTINL